MSSTSNFLDHVRSDSLAHLLTAVNLKLQSDPNTNSQPSLNCGDVVEIQGPPSSGKTHLLYSLLINCIIPQSHQSTVLGGWAKAAVVFDIDASFDAIRFNQLLLDRLTRLLSDSHIAQSIAQDSLRRLHTFCPTSSAQLAATITHLPRYHIAHFPRVAIGLVAVDSMSALYWSDRFAGEQLRTAPFPAEREKDTPEASLALRHVLIALKQFHSTHGSMVVLTNWGLYPISGTTPVIYKQHLYPFPNPFKIIRSSTSGPAGTSFSPDYLSLTYHVTVSPVPSPRFQSDISLEEAKDREGNRKPIDKFVGLIKTPKHPTTDNIVYCIASDSVSVDF